MKYFHLNHKSMNVFRFTAIGTLAIFISANFAFAQIDETVLFYESFEGPFPKLDLNNGLDIGKPNSGVNQWINNATYTGLPPTPDQTTTLQGLGQIGYPDGNYLHITANNGNANFNSSGPSERWASMPVGLCTFGFSSVKVAFWWLSGGNKTDAYGEVYFWLDSTG